MVSSNRSQTSAGLFIRLSVGPSKSALASATRLRPCFDPSSAARLGSEGSAHNFLPVTAHPAQCSPLAFFEEHLWAIAQTPRNFVFSPLHAASVQFMSTNCSVGFHCGFLVTTRVPQVFEKVEGRVGSNPVSRIRIFIFAEVDKVLKKRSPGLSGPWTSCRTPPPKWAAGELVDGQSS